MPNSNDPDPESVCPSMVEGSLDKASLEVTSTVETPPVDQLDSQSRAEERTEQCSLSDESTNPATDSELEFDSGTAIEAINEKDDTKDESIDDKNDTKSAILTPLDPLEPAPLKKTTDGESQRANTLDPTRRRRLKRKRAELDNQFAELLEGDDDFLVWRNGLGYLPGSSWKFRYNDFGLLELVEEKTPAEDCNEFISAGSSEDAGNLEPLSASSGLPLEPDDQSRPASDSRSGNGGGSGGNSNLPGDESTSLYGRRRKLRVIDGEVVGIMSKREKGSDLEKMARRPFDWTTYLEQEKAIEAPMSCFLHATVMVPTQERFQENDRLEGIDPHHESLYCVLSVAEVLGHRIRLHFDGFSDRFDFWTNTNSPFIFPVGWCQNNGRELQPPKGYSKPEFSWENYLAETRASAACNTLFVTPWDLAKSPNHLFRHGMKLEAVDKRNPQMTCVATVTDYLSDNVLVHFDDWDNGFDLWASANSPLLRPVGYCEDKEKILSLPSTWINRLSSFTWESYLEETNAQPAPSEAFNYRPPLGLQPGMKLEAVDRRCPQLIRVASVVSVDPEAGGMMIIRYDGWSDRYIVELEEDSPDLYPIGHCERQGHPLQPPPSLHDHLLNDAGTRCPTPGCKGISHVKGPKYTTHQKASGCPYSERNMKKDFRLYERFEDAGGTNTSTAASRKRSAISAGVFDQQPLVDSEESNLTPCEAASSGANQLTSFTYSDNNHSHLSNDKVASFAMPNQLHRRKRGRPRKDEQRRPLLPQTDLQPPLTVLTPQAAITPPSPSQPASTAASPSNGTTGTHFHPLSSPQPPASLIHSPVASTLRSVFHPVPPLGTSPSRSPYWPGLEERRLVQSGVLWQLVPQVSSEVNQTSCSRVGLKDWTPEKVAQFVSKIPGCQQVATAFIENEIDGQALLYLEQYDLMRILRLRLGPAVKLASAILGLRYKFPPPPPSQQNANCRTASPTIPSNCSSPSKMAAGRGIINNSSGIKSNKSSPGTSPLQLPNHAQQVILIE